MLRAVPVREVPPSTTADGLAFLQRRLALLGQISFLLSTFFFVFGNGLGMLLHRGGIQLYLPTDLSSRSHLSGASVALALWLLMRTKMRFRWSVLVAPASRPSRSARTITIDMLRRSQRGAEARP